MSRQPNPLPSYRLHRQSRQAIVTLRDPTGRRRDVLLGKYASPESKSEYHRIVAEWQATGGRVQSNGTDLTVAELILSFWRHAEGYYRSVDGNPTQEVENIRHALAPLRRLYGRTPAAQFGPLRLKAVREELVKSGLCRGVVNQRTGIIKRMIGWAVSEELLPAGAHHALKTVKGLKRGRTAAREPEPVRPVHPAHVEAILPFVLPTVAAMIHVQLLTGMRPSELCRMRVCDLATADPIRRYTPQRHKNDWRGKERTVFIGPKAQEVVRPYLKLDLNAYLFAPAEASVVHNAERRKNRKTPLWPAHVRLQAKKRAKRRRRPPGAFYDVHAYNRAIARGVSACNAARQRQAEAEGRELRPDELVPTWHANQLRHSHGTEVRRQFGLESAGASLGHTRMSATEIYAERDHSLAEQVAARIG